MSRALPVARLLLLFLSALLLPGLPLCRLVSPWSGQAWAAQPGDGKVQRLSMIGSYPEEHALVQGVIVPWIEEIREKTRGQLILTYYGPDVFMDDAALFQAVRAGHPALALQLAGRNPRQPAPGGAASLPGGPAGAVAATAAFQRLYRNFPAVQREYSELKLLALHVAPPRRLLTFFTLPGPEAEENPRAAGAALQGKKILCSTEGAALLIRALGAEALSLHPARWQAEALRLEADGAMLSFDFFQAWQLDKLPLAESLPLELGAETGWLGMNKALWEALPWETRRTLDGAAGEALGLRLAAALEEAAAENQARLAGRLMPESLLSKAEQAAWNAAVETAAREDWLQGMSRAGLDGAGKMLERLRHFQMESVREAGP